MPWADGENTLTKTYMQFLATWAKRLSWKEDAVSFRTSWEKVFHSVEWAVQWGLANRDLSNVQSIGVDEVLWQRGHKYLTVVYQIDTECKRSMRSRIDPMKKVARMLRSHRELLLNWFRPGRPFPAVSWRTSTTV